MFTALKYDAQKDVKSAVMDQSQTLSIGEVIIPGVRSSQSVVLTGGGTTAGLLGVVAGFKDKGGAALEFESYAAAADNDTNKKVEAVYFPLFIPTEFEVALDAAGNTTAGSGEYGNFAVDTTGLLLDESTYVAFGTIAAKQFFSFGLKKGSTTLVSCRYIHGAII